jgi:hypothetical protein
MPSVQYPTSEWFPSHLLPTLTHSRTLSSRKHRIVLESQQTTSVMVMNKVAKKKSNLQWRRQASAIFDLDAHNSGNSSTGSLLGNLHSRRSVPEDLSEALGTMSGAPLIFPQIQTSHPPPPPPPRISLRNSNSVIETEGGRGLSGGGGSSSGHHHTLSLRSQLSGGPAHLRRSFQATKKQRNLIDAFEYIRTAFPAESAKRRWLHLYPPHFENNYLPYIPTPPREDGLPHLHCILNWKSLIAPQALPIISEHVPDLTKDLSQFLQTPFNLSMDGDISYQDTHHLLSELIYQRLELGYQLILPSPFSSSSSSSSALHAPHHSLHPSGNSTQVNSSTPGGQLSSSASSSSLSTDHSASGSGWLKTVLGVMTTVTKDSKCIMSLGSIIHNFGAQSLGQNIEVKIYKKKKRQDPQQQPQLLSYTYWLSSSHSETYVPITTPINSNTAGNYNWNGLDQLISGFSETFLESLNYNRLRFAVIPTPSASTSTSTSTTPRPSPSTPHLFAHSASTPAFAFPASSSLDSEVGKRQEEDRIQAFSRFRNMLLGLGTAKAESTNAKHTLMDVKIIREESVEQPPLSETGRGPNSHPLPEQGVKKLHHLMDLKLVAGEMRDPRRGIPVGDKKQYFQTVKSCFVANEAVDWVLNRVEGAQTRSDAEVLLQRLLNTGHFFNVKDKSTNTPNPSTTTTFKDGTSNFYRWNEEEMKPTPSQQQPQPGISSQPQLANPRRVSSEATPQSHTTSASTSAATPLRGKQTPVLSQPPGRGAIAVNPRTQALTVEYTQYDDGIMKFQLESKSFDSRIEWMVRKKERKGVGSSEVREDERQVLTLCCVCVFSPLQLVQYDEKFKAKECYHMEFQWMVCSSYTANEVINLLVRKVH